MNYYSITTDIGNRKMNEASFSENKVQLYEIAVGDGGGEPYNPTTDMMALKGEQWRGLVSKLTIEQNIATVETVIPSEIGGFTIRELAVFDIDNNMIAIGNTPETPKVSNEEGIINEMKLQMEFSLINTDVLELKTDPNILTATKADVQELKERLENPEFDDSGEVEEISSFTDFIGSVKSKMNIFQFFKNFKAGLKYIVHTGQAVNNVTTTEPGFYLDGRVGKFLQDQITEQNKNINGNDIMKHLPLNSTNLNPFNIDDNRGNWIAGFANENMEGTFPHTGWQNIIQLDTYHFKTQLSFDTAPANSKDLYIRSCWMNDTDWQSWNKIITNSDFTWNFASQASLYTKNDSVVFDAYSYVKYNKVLNLCLFYHDWYIKSGTTIGYDEITIATINSNFIPSNGVIASTTIEGARVYINSKIDGTITMAANKIFTLTESTSIRECIIYNMT